MDGGEPAHDPVEGNREIDGSGYESSLVGSVVTASNGTIVAMAPNYPGGTDAPSYFLSYDHGHTWTGPRKLDPSATGEEVGRTYSRASFVHDDTIYFLFLGGKRGNGPISLYASTDHGETFIKRSEHLFARRLHNKNYWYLTGTARDDGSFIVYTYQGPEDEYNAPYVISTDQGRTWSEVRYAYLEKKSGIRSFRKRSAIIISCTDAREIEDSTPASSCSTNRRTL